MSTLKVNKIESTTTGGDCIVNATNIVGNKNLIINGSMQFAQRGTSSTAEGFVCDRWKTMYNGHDETPTTTQHTLTSSDTGPWEKGFRKSLHLQNGNQTSGAGAADYLLIRYVIEAQDLANSGWDYTSSSSYITLQFWVKSSVAQNFHGYLRTRDGTAQNYTFTTGTLQANTWTRVIKKIPGNSNITMDNDNLDGMYIVLHAFRGTDTTESGKTADTWSAWSDSSRTDNQTSTWWTTNDATLEFTGVQLEVGDVATAFEHRTYGDELARCQRYYYRHSDGAIYNNTTIGMACYQTSSRAQVAVHFPVTMRARTSMTVWEGSHGYQIYVNDGSDVLTGETFSLLRDGLNTAQIEITSADGDAKAAGLLANRSSSSLIDFSCEL